MDFCTVSGTCSWNSESASLWPATAVTIVFPSPSVCLAFRADVELNLAEMHLTSVVLGGTCSDGESCSCDRFLGRRLPVHGLVALRVTSGGGSCDAPPPCSNIRVVHVTLVLCKRTTHSLSTGAGTAVLWVSCPAPPVRRHTQGDVTSERQLCACCGAALRCRREVESVT